VGERVEVTPGPFTEHGDERALKNAGEVADRVDPSRPQPGGTDRAHSPDALDEQGVQERELVLGQHHEQPSGFATPLATLARNFVRATPTVTVSPTSSRAEARSRAAMCSAVPTTLRMPPTSRKASSTDSPSTSGVVRANSSNTAWLASTYAAMRGSTTTASGHRRRASERLIPVRTPHACAS